MADIDRTAFTEHVQRALRHASNPANRRAAWTAAARDVWNGAPVEDKRLFAEVLHKLNRSAELVKEAEDILLYTINEVGRYQDTVPFLIAGPYATLDPSSKQNLASWKVALDLLLARLDEHALVFPALSNQYNQHQLGKFCDGQANADFAALNKRRNEILSLRTPIDAYCARYHVGLNKTTRFVKARNLAPNKQSRALFLWLVVDEHGNVLDRFVEKIHHVNRPQYDAAKYWKGVGVTPLEKSLQNKCWTASPENFVKIRDSRVITAPDQYRIQYFIEYCPFGDLLDLLGEKIVGGQKPFPEPLLWTLFQKLAEQCLIMQRGSIDAATAPPDWRGIAHRDIKPDNIFLDLPTQSFFNKYPTPKMADFGLAIETSTLTAENNGRLAGTKGYRAPEQMREIQPLGSTEPLMLSSYTNVFAIGIVLLELMNVERVEQKHYPWGPEPHFTNFRADTNHSRSLRDLVMRCLEYEPLARITAEDLLRDIRNAMSSDTLVKAKIAAYCTQAAAGNQPDDPAEWQVQMGREKYKVMMARGPADDVNVAGSWAWIMREIRRFGNTFARTVFE